MGHSVLEMVSHSIATSHIDEGLTKTLIVPIPKVDSPTTLRDFRPISLCNVLLKVVSKVIMNKLPGPDRVDYGSVNYEAKYPFLAKRLPYKRTRLPSSEYLC